MIQKLDLFVVEKHFDTGTECNVFDFVIVVVS